MSPSFPHTLDLAHQVTLPAPASTPEDCLSATDVIDSDAETIRQRAKALTAGLHTSFDRAVALFNFVRDEIRYDIAPEFESRRSWCATATLERGSGFCQQKAVLLAALGRAIDLPTAMVHAHIRDHKLTGTRYEKMLPEGVILFHGLNAFWLNERWVYIDPSLETALCATRGYRLVEMARDSDSKLPKTDLAGDPHFDILEEIGPFTDLPIGISETVLRFSETWTRLREMKKRTGLTM